MDKDDLEQLTQFCTDQRTAFDPQLWRTNDRLDARLLAVTAHYLSMTSWYGHELELELIAEELLPGITDKRRFNTELSELGMDIRYLSATIRYRSEMRRVAERTSQRFWPFTAVPESRESRTDVTRAD